MLASLILMLSALAPAQAVPPARAALGTVDVPVDTADKRRVQLNPAATWEGKPITLAYTPLFQVGQPIGDSRPFAQLFNVEGEPIQSKEGGARLCNALDGASLIRSEHGLYSVVHAECHPGVIQVSSLDQDVTTGQLSVVSTAQLSMRSVGGGNLFCAAEATPWGTHLAAEEFEADASKLLDDGTVSNNHGYYNNMARYWRTLVGQSPYQLGWVDEVDLGAGEARIHKRYALGRFSHEQARVMPDKRTVYMTDDGTNGGFFAFVADRPGDLSSGVLYISRWTQLEGEQFSVSWLSLGHAEEEIIGQAIAQSVKFGALFEASDLGVCPDGFSRIRTSHEDRCLRLKPGQDVLASRLEPRRLGGLLGGTTELRKWEGMALDPGNRRVYAAVSSVARGMLDGDPDWDLASANHIRLQGNPCGMIMGMDMAAGPVLDSEGEAIQSDWIVSGGSPVLAGRVSAREPQGGRFSCDESGIANPDNLAYIPELRRLLVAEDTHAHGNNMLWAWDPDTGALDRVLTAPTGAEIAGLNWFPNIGGFGYLTLTIQYSDPDWRGPEDPEEIRMSTSGVIGPFPPQSSL
jgi:secreted PhoX family phosphatase